MRHAWFTVSFFHAVLPRSTTSTRRRKRRQLDGASTDWIVVRNRLSMLETRNKQLLADDLNELSFRLGFRSIDGFAERALGLSACFRKNLVSFTIAQTIDGSGPQNFVDFERLVYLVEPFGPARGTAAATLIDRQFQLVQQADGLLARRRSTTRRRSHRSEPGPRDVLKAKKKSGKRRR